MAALLLTQVAFLARSAMHPHHRLADFQARRLGAKFCNGAGVPMAERSRHRDLGMPADKCLAIGPPGKSTLDAEHYLAATRLWDRDLT
jgi:hypothetical protein